jgi:glucose/mannose-6-phosphate isomerase
MNILDSREEIAKIDKQNVLGSIEALPQQCIHAWEETSKIEVPDSYRKIDKVVMCGMGGSGLGARVIESLYADEIKVPLVRVNDYHLPKWIDENTLVICSSYSGETEETIQNVKEAIAKKTKWMAIGAGNTLIKMAQEHRVPYYQINPKYNPSNQPRMAIGYSIVGQLVLVSKAGLIEFTKNDIDQVIPPMKSVIEKTDEAKNLAIKIEDKIIAFISASHLIGATHTINNQLNENAKVFSADFSIPELNHHLLEGFSHPNVNRSILFAFFINSSLFPERIIKRFEMTREVLKKNNIEIFEYKAKAENKIAQVFETIQFGAYVNFYLSMLYGQNPAPIPWVDYFKTRLGQPLGK